MMDLLESGRVCALRISGALVFDLFADGA